MTIVEHSKTLGGKTLLLSADRYGNDSRQAIQKLVKTTSKHPKIAIHTGTEVVAVSGYIGNCTTTVEGKKGREIINHGITVLATGGRPYKPKQYHYGESTKQVVMIQCVGSRGDDLSYCSRVCCGQALKNEIRLKERQPDLQIMVLYRDMLAYGFLEDDYRKARQLGIIFSRYNIDNKPEVTLGKSKSDPLHVEYFDLLLDDTVELVMDMLVLSVGIIPEDPTTLAKILKVPVTAEKFFLEAHVKLQPVELSVDGTYVCGLAHSPKSMDETIA